MHLCIYIYERIGGISTIMWHQTGPKNELVIKYGDNMTSPKVASFDWDFTLIKPTNGMWQGSAADPTKSSWFNTSVPSKLEYLHRAGYHVVIFSQRSSLTNVNFFNRRAILVRKRYDHFIKQLSFTPTIIITCANESVYNKPNIGAWNVVVDECVDKSLSFYVGDCAGRPDDRSNNDYLFALNVGVDFDTPENFFKDYSRILTAC